jgi:protein-tyrosine phosphatase
VAPRHTRRHRGREPAGRRRSRQQGVRLAALERAYREHGLVFHRIPVPDGDDRNLAVRLREIVALLGRLIDAGGRVYLHCNAGLNRAPTVAIAYLHVREDVPLADARDEVKRLRHCVPYMRALEGCFGPARS